MQIHVLRPLSVFRKVLSRGQSTGGSRDSIRVDCCWHLLYCCYISSGSTTTPLTGYNTPNGIALSFASAVAPYPSSLVNRHLSSHQTSSLSRDRGPEGPVPQFYLTLYEPLGNLAANNPSRGMSSQGTACLVERCRVLIVS
jgi:hypothetical protein